MADQCPEELLHLIFTLLPTRADLASASAACKHWYRADSSSRLSIKVRNCFAVAPSRLVRRFVALKFITLCGYPDVHDLGSIPRLSKFQPDQWIETLAANCKELQRLKLKRIIVTDRMLQLIAQSFPDLKSLVFVQCGEISNTGLGLVASNCRMLQVLELKKSKCKKDWMPWFTAFPESFESLESLSGIDVSSENDWDSLVKLVSRCRNLKSLKLSGTVKPDILTRIMEAVPQIVHLGLGAYVPLRAVDGDTKFKNAVMKCTSVQCLSGTFFADSLLLFYSLCSKLLVLDLTEMRMGLRNSLVNFILQCHSLQQLRVRENVGDDVLRAVGSTCKDLRELGLFSHETPPRFGMRASTEVGLNAVSEGCRKLRSVTYSSFRMSNAALVALAQQNPDISSFTISLLAPAGDCETSLPFDEGIGAIIQSCKNLKKLSIYNAQVTDQVLLYAGMFSAHLEKLSISFSGESDKGILYALKLCQSLKEVVFRDSPFGDATFLAAAEMFKNLQFLWIASCEVTMTACKKLGDECPMLTVDILSQVGTVLKDNQNECPKLLIYHSLDEPAP